MQAKLYLTKFNERECIAEFKYNMDAIRMLDMCNKVYDTPSENMFFELEYDDE